VLGGADGIVLGDAAVAVDSVTLSEPDGGPLPALGAEAALSSWFGPSADSEQPSATRAEQATREVGFMSKYIDGTTPGVRQRGQRNVERMGREGLLSWVQAVL
jgi:hypothetical protein